MKPILIPVRPDKDGRIHITMKELSDMLDKAYIAGKSDGSGYYYCPYHYTYCGTGITNDPNKTYITLTNTGTTSSGYTLQANGNTTSATSINSTQ